MRKLKANSLGKSIIRGVKQALAYKQGKKMDVKVHKVKIPTKKA